MQLTVQVPQVLPVKTALNLVVLDLILQNAKFKDVVGWVGCIPQNIRVFVRSEHDK